MGRKKITVVNIDDNDTKNDDVVDVTEPTDKPIEIQQEVIEIPEVSIVDATEPLRGSSTVMEKKEVRLVEGTEPLRGSFKVEESPKDLETPPVETPPVKQPETQTKTRSQELIKCPKCNKMVTAKTLKYSHKNTCSGEEKNQLKKEKPLPKPEVRSVAATDTAVGSVVPIHDIEEVPVPTGGRMHTVPRPKLVAIPEKVTITPEMMREHRQQMMRDRINLRQDKMKNLFNNSIK